MADINGRQRENRVQVLEQLFTEHGTSLRSFLKARIGSDENLENIVKKVFLRLASMEDLFDRLGAGGNSKRTFILNTANNLAMELESQKVTRRQSYTAPKEEERQRVVDVTLDKIAQVSQELDMMRRAILELRPTWRRVFVLNRFEHKSYGQIADEMGYSVKQVEKYMSGALSLLRGGVMKALEAR